MHVSLSGVEGCFSKYGWKNYVYIFLVALMILSYVGITNDLIIRFNQHREGHNPLFYTYNRRPLEFARSNKF